MVFPRLAYQQGGSSPGQAFAGKRSEPRGPKEAYGGDQGRLRVDLRLSATDADDVGAEYSLYGHPTFLFRIRMRLIARILRLDLGLFVQNHVQQGTMNFEFSVIFDEA